MGLTFSVGGPEEVFAKPFANDVRQLLEEEFGGATALGTSDPHYWSDEVGWSGWSGLQELAAKQLGQKGAEHLLSMEARCGVYLPVEIKPTAFQFDGHATPLDIASLPRLTSELEALGKLLALSTADAGLRALATKYAENDDLVDSDMELQTFAQLLLAAHEASRRKAPLWIVK